MGEGQIELGVFFNGGKALQSMLAQVACASHHQNSLSVHLFRASSASRQWRFISGIFCLICFGFSGDWIGGFSREGK